ncbi:MAG TPA: NAD(P)-dependent oxidoreductase [Chitinophagaceae bacterium]|nr:NAD(P)-dependent oxidoreductase [Chitinophagaceae bacterium]
MAIRNNRLKSEEYEKNFSDIRPPFENREAALVEANRCLYCYDAPCTKSCPTSINIPKFIRQIATDDLKGSAHTIFSANIFGGGCARVCPVEKLCEGACVYNLLHEEPIAIARLQRWSTEPAIRQKRKLFQRKPTAGKKVAVVGAGPAGLSCAHVLSREGVDVTVFEKESKGGGLMTYGIAAYKVTPSFCQDEVDFITSLGGIEIRYNQELGKNLRLDQLRSEFDAVYLAMGVGLANRLNIAGEELDGVVDAIRFIYELRSRSYSEIPVGDRVAVIGMGMTAIDAATQARRLGAKEVTMIYRRSEAEKNCTQYELDLAKLDGCNMEWLAAPKEIVGQDGKVKALVCEKMKLGPPDHTGKPAPEPTGELISFDVDMVIKATGQSPFVQLVEQLGLRNAKGKLVVHNKAVTSIGGVFAGGDCVNGGKEVVDAVQAGKDGAAAILEFMKMSNQ